MRINPTTSGIEQQDNNKTGRAGQPANQSSQANASAAAITGANSGASASIDRTQFSFDQARVQMLQSQALAEPEIRQAKVSSLGRRSAAADIGGCGQGSRCDHRGVQRRQLPLAV